VAQPASTDPDRHWLALAVDLSERCVPSPTAFSVGAVVVTANGNLLATGFSRETDPADHAEEVALAKAAAGGGRPLLRGATMYSSLEPCAARSSRPVPCAGLIIASGIGRVVIAWLEPPIFVAGGGAVRLREAGLTVDVLPEFADAARAVNAHLLQGLPVALPGRSRAAAARCPPGSVDAATWRTPSARSCA
jgi:diaminohydroxyphosphoribosylaminopyrimidine deaminase / 5-amino-6-(5-phosphoribosylamino)uracil reductase